jgi:hypothetical protein
MYHRFRIPTFEWDTKVRTNRIIKCPIYIFLDHDIFMSLKVWIRCYSVTAAVSTKKKEDTLQFCVCFLILWCITDTKFNPASLQLSTTPHTKSPVRCQEQESQWCTGFNQECTNRRSSLSQEYSIQAAILHDIGGVESTQRDISNRKQMNINTNSTAT